MKKTLLLVSLVITSFYGFTQTKLNDENLKCSSEKISNLKYVEDGNWEQKAKDYLQQAEYNFEKKLQAFVVANPKQKLSFTTNVSKITTKPFSVDNQSENDLWDLSMDFVSMAKDKHSAILIKNNLRPILQNNELVYSNDDVAIEYINKENGLRQNFIIKNKPVGSENLTLNINIQTTLGTKISNCTSLSFYDRKNSLTLLSYDGLKVWDANHKLLNANMRLDANNNLQIIVEDKDAKYPITVDPLTHSPEWNTSANGVLPGLLTNLQLKIDAIYGYNVAGLGDVNNDGFDDVAIGSPGAIDIISGPTTLIGAGAVFIYFGSKNGLPTVPSRTLRATTPVVNALFGYSVAGGNVTGTSNNDVIVGAPGDSYQTSASSILGPTSVTVTAGKVYVFDGSSLSSGPSSPLLSIYLNGTSYFSVGILNLLASNVSAKALFGFSVAVTGDMGTDALGEIIVGAPGYLGFELLSARSGAAYVFNSNALVSNTATSLNAPALAALPGLLNLDGLLFGYSVDGAGDYNKDGKQDVVVGAPGGQNLGVLGLLGGSAYVFPGTGAGVSSSYISQLTPSTPLLGSVANLFGFSVKGVKNASGVRTGNLLISAPVGNILSNILGGLRLQAGNIYVFPAKLSPSSNEISAQSLTSPRGSNLITQLLSLNINLKLLFGASMDNAMDVNGDGIGDLIVGEPLSTAVGLINANILGGEVYIYTGKPDGTYNTTPYWRLTNQGSYAIGLNAASLIGFSVAGAGHTNGSKKAARILIGSPGNMLDFSSGILNIGQTVGTIFDFAAGDNGIGNAYTFGLGSDITIKPDVNATHINVMVPGNVHTNDDVPLNTTYGTPVALSGNPGVPTLTMNANGNYQFTASVAGVYRYNVPVCVPTFSCEPSELTITVLQKNGSLNPPIVNTDFVVTSMNTPVTVKSLANDAAGNVGGELYPSSVTIVETPRNGTASVNTLTGDITYTPTTGYVGTDTLRYNVCDNSTPVALCGTAMQIFFVKSTADVNSTFAADDFVHVGINTAASGNVKINDTDAEGDQQDVAIRNISIPDTGTFTLSANGDFLFTPVSGFVGAVSFTYSTCDNGSPSACAGATVYILVTDILFADLTPTTRLSNGTFVEPAQTSRDFVIEVNEILGHAADNINSPITVRITKSSNFGYSFNPLTTTSNIPSPIAVNNADWDLTTNSSSLMIFTLKPTSTISGFGVSRISITLKVLQGASSGAENQTISVINGSGGEVNFANNSVVRILNIAN